MRCLLAIALIFALGGCATVQGVPQLDTVTGQVQPVHCSTHAVTTITFQSHGHTFVVWVAEDGRGIVGEWDGEVARGLPQWVHTIRMAPNGRLTTLTTEPYDPRKHHGPCADLFPDMA